MFNVHWKVLDTTTGEWNKYSRKVDAATPAEAAQKVSKKETGAVIEKVKKCEQ
jgi:hypothetical protein